MAADQKKLKRSKTLIDEATERVPTMLAGSSAGFFSRMICHPIDTIKAQIQVNTARKSFYELFQRTVKTEGLPGLYRGIGVSALGSLPASCLYFAGYEASRDFLRARKELQGVPFAADFMAGFSAEAFSCVLWVPIDVTKERLQVQSTLSGAAKYKGSAHAIRTIMRTEGVAGIYKGYFATLASFGPFSALYFVFYEQLKQATMRRTGVAHEDQLSALQAFGHGAGAGALASWLTNGLDMAKLRLQVQGERGTTAFRYSGMISALGGIVQREGIGALFKGSAARIMFFVPSQAVSIALFERFKALYRDLLEPRAHRGSYALAE